MGLSGSYTKHLVELITNKVLLVTKYKGWYSFSISGLVCLISSFSNICEMAGVLFVKQDLNEDHLTFLGTFRNPANSTNFFSYIKSCFVVIIFTGLSVNKLIEVC